jgi:hypothetical protein
LRRKLADSRGSRNSTGKFRKFSTRSPVFLRQQYSLSYSPTTGAKDGKFHKITVELVALDGGPLTIVNQKGKKQKYQVYAREGYQSIKGGAGD